VRRNRISVGSKRKELLYIAVNVFLLAYSI